MRGVNPADNLTKIELLPKLTVIDDRSGISVFATSAATGRRANGPSRAAFDS